MKVGSENLPVFRTFLILYGNYRWTHAQNHKSIQLPYVLRVYGCENWYLALEEEQRPTAF
jgi:hypothetical protein